MNRLAVTRPWHDCVTEAVKVTSLRRNVAIGSAVGFVALATPWLFVWAFQWLAEQGLAAAPMESIALSHRNQTAALALALLLGIQAYVSDASSGVLAFDLAIGRRGFWQGPQLGKLLFGVVYSLVFGLAISASAALCFLFAGGAAPGLSSSQVGWFWASSTVGLVASLVLYYLIGLVVSALVRSKGLAIAVGLAFPFLALPLAKGVLVTVVPSAEDVTGWLLPTELVAAVVAWVPGGNTLMNNSVGDVRPHMLLLLAWLVLASGLWLGLLHRRTIYPADVG